MDTDTAPRTKAPAMGEGDPHAQGAHPTPTRGPPAGKGGMAACRDASRLGKRARRGGGVCALGMGEDAASAGDFGRGDGAVDISARLATAPGPSAFCTIVTSPSVRWSGF